MTTKIPLIIIAMFLFYGCGITTNYNPEESTGQVMLAERIGKGSLYGGGEEGIDEGLYIIREEDEWDSLKRKMDKTNAVSQNLKQVNFNEQMVLVYFDPVRPNGAYSVQIYEVIELKSEIIVNVKLVKNELPATTVMIQPFHMVAVPITSKPINAVTKEIIE